jgi:peptidoglycan-associated lipoprotein
VKQWIKVILISSAALMLAGCAHKRQDQSAINDANAAYSGNAQGVEASGLGRRESFGDQAVGSRSQLSKRTYYFDFNSFTVHDQDLPAVNANASYLLAHPYVRVIVAGHTDPRGSREYNIGLGERRAKAVASILLAKGVKRSQLRIVSYGAEKLASPGHTEADYQLDRRVVLIYQR